MSKINGFQAGCRALIRLLALLRTPYPHDIILPDIATHFYLHIRGTDMNTNTKAIFLDLDGTLLNDDKQVTPGNQEAIDKALAAGHKVIISTGRPTSSALRLADKLGLNAPGCFIIAYNGGVIYDAGAKKVVFKVAIPLDVVYGVFEKTNARGIHAQTYGEVNIIVEPPYVNAFLDRYCQKTGMSYEVIDDIHNLKEEPVKILLVNYDEHEPLEKFRNEVLLTEYADDLSTFFSCPEYLEIVKKGLNKGDALLRLAEILDIPVENTYACGDAANDLDMIKAAGTGICMINGMDIVKEAADYITVRDNNHDGIAEVIEKFLL